MSVFTNIPSVFCLILKSKTFFELSKIFREIKDVYQFEMFFKWQSSQFKIINVENYKNENCKNGIYKNEQEKYDFIFF